MDRPFYSITFGTKNTWDEWALMPIKAGRIEFATAEVKSEYVEVPGSDDALDFTEALTGYPTYDPRKGSMKFRFFDNKTPARSRFNQLKNYLHGRRMKAVIDDEPEYYYIGRFMVGDFEPKQGNWGDVEISYVLNAYKLEMNGTTEDWLWDPFNFETGVIREYGSIHVDYKNSSLPLAQTVIGSRKPSVPKIVLEDYHYTGVIAEMNKNVEFTMTYGGTKCTLWKLTELNRGLTKIFPNIVLMDDEYEFSFNFENVYSALELWADISIDFRGGSL